MRPVLLATTALTGGAFLALAPAGTAHADCLPAAPGDGAEIVCSGNVTAPVGDGGFDEVTIIVEGTVQTGAATAVVSQGDFTTIQVLPTGTIESDTTAIALERGGSVVVGNDSSAFAELVDELDGLDPDDPLADAEAARLIFTTFTAGIPGGTGFGTIVGDIDLSTSVGGAAVLDLTADILNFGTITGDIIGSDVEIDTLILNAGTLTGNIDLDFAISDVPASGFPNELWEPVATVLNSGTIVGDVSLGGFDSLFANLRTGDDLVDYIPFFVSEFVEDDAEQVELLRDLAMKGVPGGAALATTDGDVTMTADLNTLINLGIITGDASMTAAPDGFAGDLENVGLRGLNMVYNALGAKIEGSLTLSGGDVIDVDGTLFRSRVLNFGTIGEDLVVDGASTTVVNGAVTELLTLDFFRQSGASQADELALLRAGVPDGAAFGTIGGNVEFNDAAHAFLNLGLVGGDVAFGDGDNVFGNVGEIAGGVSFGDGDNVAFIGASSVIAGQVVAGGGDNLLHYFGTGAFDAAKFENFGTIVFDTAPDGGSNVITVAGTLDAAVMEISAGSTLELDGGSFAGTVVGRTVTVAGTVVGDVDLGTGDDATFTIDQGGSVTGGLDGGSGANSTLNLDLGGILDNDIVSFTTLNVSSPDSVAPLLLGGTVEIEDEVVVQTGGLRVMGNLTVPNLTVASGGLLGGTGVIEGDVGFSAGSLFSPGASIGTTTILGNLDLAAGMITEIEVDAAGNHDLIDVDGDVSLAGSLRVLTLGSAGGYAASTDYTFLTFTGNRTGEFEEPVLVSAFFDPTLTYNPGDVTLTLDRNQTGIGDIGATPNQTGVGKALGGFEQSGAPGFQSFFQKFLALSEEDAREVLDSVSGDAHVPTQAAGTQSVRRLWNTVLGRIQSLAFSGAQDASSALGYAGQAGAASQVDGIFDAADAPLARQVNVWGQGFGSTGRRDATDIAAATRHTGRGFVAGADMPVGEAGFAGVMGGYSNHDVKTRDRGADSDIDQFDVAAYGGVSLGAWRLSGTGGYAHQRIETRRDVLLAGSAHADYSANVGHATAEIGHVSTYGNVALEPFARLGVVHREQQGFTEEGIGALGLVSTGETTTTVTSTLGATVAARFDLAGGGHVTPFARLGWQHAHGDLTPTRTFTFAGGGTPFTVVGAPDARDTALADLGAQLGLAGNWTATVNYSGAFARGGREHAGTARVNVAF